jgi:predicted dehydrogenase
MDKTPGIGIIGTGIHGSRYALHIKNDLPGLNLAAISRRSSEGESQAAGWNCRYHADWRHLVDDPSVDAVVAAVTPDLNPEIARACAGAGKPLLMEKPLAVNAEEGQRALDAFAGTGLPFTVAQTLRYNSVILGLRRELGLAGDLHAFSANQRLERSVHPWLENAAVAGGGVILHTVVHLFDALRFITGREVLAVDVRSRRRYNPALEDLVAGRLILSGDLIGTFDAAKVGPSRMGRYEFFGDRGQVQGDQVHGGMQLIAGMEIRELPCPRPGPALVPFLGDWETCLRGKGPNPIPASEGLAAVRICDAARLSAAEEREVIL